MERTGIVGSIGVVAAIPKQVSADKDGYVDIEIVSSNAPNKRPDPTTKTGSAEIRSTLDAIEKSIHRRRRPRPQRVSRQGDRRFRRKAGSRSAPTAVKAGMADKVQSQETTLNSLRRMVAQQSKSLQSLKN
jgi:hypothetical protein